MSEKNNDWSYTENLSEDQWWKSHRESQWGSMMEVMQRISVRINENHTEGLGEDPWKSYWGSWWTHMEITLRYQSYSKSLWWFMEIILRVLMTIHGNNTDSAITRACQASDFGMLTFLSKNLEYICMSSSQFSSFFSNTGLGGSSSVKAEMDKLVKHNKS